MCCGRRYRFYVLRWIKPGYKSIAYSLSFRAKDRNLEDADITGAMDRIVNALERVGAELRK